jgi:hypothetical protein
MAAPVVIAPRCSVCGRPSSRIELFGPGTLPPDRDGWNETARRRFDARDADRWWMRFSGVVAGSGHGDPIDAERAARIIAAFAEPISFERVRTAGLYCDAGICGTCERPYCSAHWNVSTTGYGWCPEGHGKSLDPHWSPED